MSALSDIKAHPVRAFAVVCVAAIATFLGYMAMKLNDTLSSPQWCRQAIGADRADADSKVDAAQACIGLLTIQLKSVSTNSHVLFGAQALCLVTLIVIVIAGARLSGSVSKEGVNLDLDRSGTRKRAAAAGAQATAKAAEEKAEQITEAAGQPATGFTPPPGEQL